MSSQKRFFPLCCDGMCPSRHLDFLAEKNFVIWSCERNNFFSSDLISPAIFTQQQKTKSGHLLKAELVYDKFVGYATLGCIFEGICVSQYTTACLPYSLQHYSRQPSYGTAEVSISRWMDKGNVVQAHSGVLVSHQKEKRCYLQGNGWNQRVSCYAK